MASAARRMRCSRAAAFLLRTALKNNGCFASYTSSVTFGDSSPEGVSLMFMRCGGAEFCESLNLFAALVKGATYL